MTTFVFLTRSLCLGAALSLSACVMSMPPQVTSAPALPLTAAQVDRIGQRIWQSECDGTVSGLTSWNSGEEFASLGIGHFIWYPRGFSGPFEESFPPLVNYLAMRGIALPTWLKQTPHCPWSSRAEFERDKNGQHQRDLRELLSKTVREQTEFIIARLQRAAPQLTASSPNARVNFQALSQSAPGLYAMIDYVNFKGDGLNPKERYNGQGWGLAQVLAEMTAPTPAGFADAAKRVLSRRVQNAPPARGEGRWLKGWHQRCDGYRKPL